MEKFLIVIIGALLVHFILLGVKRWKGNQQEDSSTVRQQNTSPPQSPLDLEIVSQPMEEDRFWAIIANSKSAASSESELLDQLYQRLDQLPLSDVVAFNLRSNLLMAASYTSELWCAAYIMNRGCGDDGFEYFRSWLISQGRDIYTAAVESADSLVEQLDDRVEEYGFEGFLYIPYQVFTDKTQADLLDYQDSKDLKYVEFEFNWEEDDPASMKKICPRLYEHFNGDAQ